MFIVNNKSKSLSNGAVPRRPPSHKSSPGIKWSFGPNFIGCTLIIIIIVIIATYEVCILSVDGRISNVQSFATP